MKKSLFMAVAALSILCADSVFANTTVTYSNGTSFVSSNGLTSNVILTNGYLSNGVWIQGSNYNFQGAPIASTTGVAYVANGYQGPIVAQSGQVCREVIKTYPLTGNLSAIPSTCRQAVTSTQINTNGTVSYNTSCLAPNGISYSINNPGQPTSFGYATYRGVECMS